MKQLSIVIPAPQMELGKLIPMYFLINIKNNISVDFIMALLGQGYFSQSYSYSIYNS